MTTQIFLAALPSLSEPIQSKTTMYCQVMSFLKRAKLCVMPHRNNCVSGPFVNKALQVNMIWDQHHFHLAVVPFQKKAGYGFATVNGEMCRLLSLIIFNYWCRHTDIWNIWWEWEPHFHKTGSSSLLLKAVTSHKIFKLCLSKHNYAYIKNYSGITLYKKKIKEIKLK